MKDNWLFSPNGQGMTISIGLHLFVLALAYYMQPTSSSGPFIQQAYSIALQSTCTLTKHHTSANKPQEQVEIAHKTLPRANKISERQIKNKYSRFKKYPKNQPNGSKVPPNITPSHKAPKIDERGLYKRGKQSAKQADATLELKGWEWDSVPDPKDTTEECGKIVFKIKVDKDGEIISIETIEKTVTPMVEKIYADALRALTFSKTVDIPSSISIGKVTFVLVGK